MPADTRTFVSYINAYIAYYAGNFVTLTFRTVSADTSRSGVPRRQLYGFHDVSEICRVNQPYKTAIRQHLKHRYDQNLIKPQILSARGHFFTSHTMWNSLPESIVSTVRCFTSRLDKFLV